MTETRKAWQEPMVWLMVGIPALTVVAGFATLIIALQSGPMDMVPASVQRVSQAQTLDGAERAGPHLVRYCALQQRERGHIDKRVPEPDDPKAPYAVTLYFECDGRT